MEVDAATKVDPKNMSLADLIKADKDKRASNRTDNGENSARRGGRGGIRDRIQGGRPRFNERGGRSRPNDSFRARRTGNMI